MIREVSGELLTIDQVAQHLKLHARTVRKYVRDGRLKATRIGKAYRIARADLEAFTGHSFDERTRSPTNYGCEIEASCIIEVHPIDADGVSRLTNLLLGAAKGISSTGGSAQLKTIHHADRDRLKVIVSGDPSAAAGILELISAFRES